MTETQPISATAEQLKPLLRSLSLSDRVGLAHFLWDSVEGEESASEEETKAAWKEEILKRIAEAESKNDPGIPSEEVHRRIREEFS
jgi:putative addiction module component (TIGR02574 family)